MTTAIVSKASKPLRDAGVTGFSTSGMSALIYFGSFLWFSVLIAADVYALTVWDVMGDVLEPTIVATISLNGIMFLLQTLNLVYYQFKLWAIVSLYWTCQLTVIGITSAWVGYALVYPEVHFLSEGDEDSVRQSRVAVLVLRLFAQCLFTSSQFSVTLEYLHRAVVREPPRVIAPPTRRLPPIQRRYSR